MAQDIDFRISNTKLRRKIKDAFMLFSVGEFARVNGFKYFMDIVLEKSNLAFNPFYFQIVFQ